jgi:hypothetical protein
VFLRLTGHPAEPEDSDSDPADLTEADPTEAGSKNPDSEERVTV